LRQCEVRWLDVPRPVPRACVHCHSFFFFQAEDGIRDPLVTGVQTCALPISMSRGHEGTKRNTVKSAAATDKPFAVCQRSNEARRSEERRVGKEGRARGGAEKQGKERGR